MNAQQLSDEQLLARMRKICLKSARLLATLLVHLIEVEERRLHLKGAYCSMSDFCRRSLGMSPNEAWRRTTAARVVRRVPALLDYVRRGELCLSTLLLLRHYITEENAAELIRATSSRSKREVEHYLAHCAPRPDVPSRLRRLRDDGSLGNVSSAYSWIEELSPGRHRLEATITDATRDIVEQTRDLLSHTNPTGDLDPLIRRAFTLLLAEAKKERFGANPAPAPIAPETLSPQPKAASTRAPKPARPKPPAKASAIPRAVRRAVFERDGHRCTHVDEAGNRCVARAFLQLDHIVPRARGGTDEIENLRVVCGAHNRLYAEESFGKRYVAERIEARRAGGNQGTPPRAAPSG